MSKQKILLSFIANDTRPDEPISSDQELLKEIELDTTSEANFGWKLIGATTAGIENASGSGYCDRIVDIIEYSDITRLVGKMLTILDASIQDRDQRDALKKITKQNIYAYYNDIQRRSAYRVNKTPTYIYDIED